MANSKSALKFLTQHSALGIELSVLLFKLLFRDAVPQRIVKLAVRVNHPPPATLQRKTKGLMQPLRRLVEAVNLDRTFLVTPL